jgi:hypothetical protein
MKTMKEFLTWYNNKDVEPMLKAIDKMFQFNQNSHIDMFKDSISVPGLALKYMFQDLPDYFTLPDEKNKDLYDLCFQCTEKGFVRGELADVEFVQGRHPFVRKMALFFGTAVSFQADYFTLPDEKNKDLCDLFKNNIVGGPSIVFHRYHEKDKTFIRPKEYDDPKPCKSIIGNS